MAIKQKLEITKIRNETPLHLVSNLSEHEAHHFVMCLKSRLDKCSTGIPRHEPSRAGLLARVFLKFNPAQPSHAAQQAVCQSHQTSA